MVVGLDGVRAGQGRGNHRRRRAPDRAPRASTRRTASGHGDRRRRGTRHTPTRCSRRSPSTRSILCVGNVGRTGRHLFHAADGIGEDAGRRRRARRRSTSSPAAFSRAARPRRSCSSTARIPCTRRRKRGRCARRSTKCRSSQASASFVDETSVLADLILPGPLVSRIVVGRRARVRVAGCRGERGAAGDETAAQDPGDAGCAARSRPASCRNRSILAWKTFDEMLKASFAGAARRRGRHRCLERRAETGRLVGRAEATRRRRQRRSPARRAAAAYAEPKFDGDAQQYPFHFLPYPSQAFLDGSLAHLPWLQEMPDPMTSAMWSSWVEINPQTAEQPRHARRRHRGNRVAARVVRAPRSSRRAWRPTSSRCRSARGTRRSPATRAVAARIRSRFSRR